MQNDDVVVLITLIDEGDDFVEGEGGLAKDHSINIRLEMV
jgi:hypothetical protein